MICYLDELVFRKCLSSLWELSESARVMYFEITGFNYSLVNIPSKHTNSVFISHLYTNLYCTFFFVAFVLLTSAE